VYQHPALLEAMKADHVAELRRCAGTTARLRPQTGERRLVAAARRGAGWLLVDLGLRLAVPRGGGTEPVARGPR
jgi:hypothetical protein